MIILQILAGLGLLISLITRPISTIIVYGILALVGLHFCEISPTESYSWYSGIWHGLFFVPNMFASWVLPGEVLNYSDNGSFFYYVWLWIVTLSGGASSMIFGK